MRHDFSFSFLAMGRLPTDSVSTRQDTTIKRRDWTAREEEWEDPSLDNRLSCKRFFDLFFFFSFCVCVHNVWGLLETFLCSNEKLRSETVLYTGRFNILFC